MKINNHRLFLDDTNPAKFQRIPDRNIGRGRLTPKFLVIHYTAGGGMESSISWFKNPSSRVSAHLVIGRDGSIVQLVPFNQIAYHAGDSYWHGYRSLNLFSIGIELDNAGMLVQNGAGKWIPNFRRNIPEEDIIIAHHKHNNSRAVGWHNFTNEQIETAVEVGALLKEKYNLKGVVGHDDISPGRKIDPGPAFPMNGYSSRVMGRNEERAEIFKTTSALNIRVGPGITYQTLPESPLPKDLKVEILDENHPTWKFVDIIDPVNGVSGLQGWVHGRFLVEVES